MSSWVAFSICSAHAAWDAITLNRMVAQYNQTSDQLKILQKQNPPASDKSIREAVVSLEGNRTTLLKQVQDAFKSSEFQKTPNKAMLVEQLTSTTALTILNLHPNGIPGADTSTLELVRRRGTRAPLDPGSSILQGQLKKPEEELIEADTDGAEEINAVDNDRSPLAELGGGVWQSIC